MHLTSQALFVVVGCHIGGGSGPNNVVMEMAVAVPVSQYSI